MNDFEHGLHKYFTGEQLELISKAKIGIGGAGGLGSNCAMILVRSGFKHIEMLDFDVIDASNLNRQQFFYNEIGQSKIGTTQKRLLAINPDLKFTGHKLKWAPENADNFFKDSDVVIEAFDNADFKYQFAQYYHDKFPLVVSGNGMAGLTEKNEFTVKKLGNLRIVGDHSTDAAKGHPPLAPRVIRCAAMMAEIVLDHTLRLDQ